MSALNHQTLLERIGAALDGVGLVASLQVLGRRSPAATRLDRSYNLDPRATTNTRAYRDGRGGVVRAQLALVVRVAHSLGKSQLADYFRAVGDVEAAIGAVMSATDPNKGGVRVEYANHQASVSADGDWLDHDITFTVDFDLEIAVPAGVA